MKKITEPKVEVIRIEQLEIIETSTRDPDNFGVGLEYGTKARGSLVTWPNGTTQPENNTEGE